MRLGKAERENTANPHFHHHTGPDTPHMNHTHPQPSRTYIGFRILALLWMTTIFIASNQSSVLPPSLFSGMDKLMHLAAYGILGLLLLLSLKQWHKRLSWKTVWLITLATTLYGLSDEIHQSFVPGRYPSLGDIVADGLGGFLAVVLVRFMVLKKWVVNKPEVSNDK